MEKTIREYLKEGAGFLPSQAPNALIGTQEYLDMPASEFFQKAKGCFWVLLNGVYEVGNEDN